MVLVDGNLAGSITLGSLMTGIVWHFGVEGLKWCDWLLTVGGVSVPFHWASYLHWSRKGFSPAWHSQWLKVQLWNLHNVTCAALYWIPRESIKEWRKRHLLMRGPKRHRHRIIWFPGTFIITVQVGLSLWLRSYVCQQGGWFHYLFLGKQIQGECISIEKH